LVHINHIHCVSTRFRLLHQKSEILIRFLIDKISALTLCPTATWLMNATTVAGSRTGVSGATATRLNLPTSIFVDNTSTVYVADSANFRVQRFPSSSTTGIEVIAGSSGTALNQFLSSK
jgi:hypothetical protein